MNGNARLHCVTIVNKCRRKRISQIQHPGSSAKDGEMLQRMPMTDICQYVHEGMELQLRLNSDTSLLQAPEGWYQVQPWVEGFKNVIFMRGDQPFE
ncbi:uncharacterized protein TNCV_1184131 [Trichonephila clavipes]|nr:uncharacterized protein TNCV_1184131 [Trichonephila clavipes]